MKWSSDKPLRSIDGVLPQATKDMVSDPFLFQPRNYSSSICSYMGKLYINPYWRII